MLISILLITNTISYTACPSQRIRRPSISKVAMRRQFSMCIIIALLSIFFGCVYAVPVAHPWQEASSQRPKKHIPFATSPQCFLTHRMARIQQIQRRALPGQHAAPRSTLLWAWTQNRMAPTCAQEMSAEMVMHQQVHNTSVSSSFTAFSEMFTRSL